MLYRTCGAPYFQLPIGGVVAAVIRNVQGVIKTSLRKPRIFQFHPVHSPISGILKISAPLTNFVSEYL